MVDSGHVKPLPSWEANNLAFNYGQFFNVQHCGSEVTWNLKKFSQQVPSLVLIQAEDGIRDFCLSRGLGDVYKRQTGCILAMQQAL